MGRQADPPVSAIPLLGRFAAAGTIGWAGVHVAQTLGRRCAEDRPEVLLAAALCVRAQQDGSVCLPIEEAAAGRFFTEPQDDDPDAEVTELARALEWPTADEWLQALAGSPMVSVGAHAPVNQRPLRLVDGLLYLEKNWRQEEVVRRQLLERVSQPPPSIPPAALASAVESAFADWAATDTLRQREAVSTALRSWTSVIAGGPGTGKTTTIARLLGVLDRLSTGPTRVGLASFTGKAAARMQQSLDASLAESGRTAHDWEHLQVSPAETLHRMLGSRPGRGMGRDEDNPLPHDVLIVDEMSMVSLELMGALMRALRPGCRLVMVGDPDQLSSVDAGAVLADIVAAGLPIAASDPASAITVLDRAHRFSAPIQRLADAIRTADPDTAIDLLTAGSDELVFEEIDPDPRHLAEIPGLADDLVSQGRAMHSAAAAGRVADALAAVDAHRLLCAHRRGRYGVAAWARAAETLLQRAVPGYGREGEWYPGRPVMITRNAAELHVSNGDTGVVVLLNGQPEVAIGSSDAPRLRSPWLLDNAESMHALTVHKSQGSEYDTVTLIAPTESRLLTRGLLYTALTRARHRIRIVGTRDAIATAIMTPARRATGLAARMSKT